MGRSICHPTLIGQGLVRMILVDDSFVSMKQLSRTFLGVGRSARAPTLSKTVKARSCNYGTQGGVLFP